MPQATHTIENLSVHFISLVDAPANRRAFLIKRAGAEEHVYERQVVIAKRDAVRRMVYGLVLVPGEVDDAGDTITADEIEKAAYGFLRSGATSQIDADHDRETGKGFVAESWIVRAADPLFPDETPGSWAVGVKVTDEAVWQRVADGDLVGFSVMGLARREPVGVAESEGDEAAVEKDAAGGMAGRFVALVKEALFGAAGAAEEATLEERAVPVVPGEAVVEEAEQRIEHGGEEAISKVEEAMNASTNEAVGFAGHLAALTEALPEPVEKGAVTFRTELGKELLWQGTSALRAAISEAIDSEAMDTLGGVQTAIADFAEWLLGVLGHDIAIDPERKAGLFAGSQDGAVAEPVVKEEADEAAPADEGADLEALVEKWVAEVVAPLREQLEALSRATPGRQTVLGGADAEADRAGGKGYRGLRIRV